MAVIEKPAIAITMGDPCGIGPEVVVKALSQAWVYASCRPSSLKPPGGPGGFSFPVEIHQLPDRLQWTHQFSRLCAVDRVSGCLICPYQVL